MYKILSLYAKQVVHLALLPVYFVFLKRTLISFLCFVKDIFLYAKQVVHLALPPVYFVFQKRNLIFLAPLGALAVGGISDIS